MTTLWTWGQQHPVGVTVVWLAATATLFFVGWRLW